MTSLDLLRDLLSSHPGTFILVLVMTYLLWRIYSRPRNLPPGPKPWPLIGNLGYFRDYSLQYLDYQRLGKEYGDVASLYFGRRLHVVLNKQSAIKEAWVTRGLEFQDRNPALLGNDYVNFIDEVFNCPVSEEWLWKKKFALKAMKSVGFGTKASEERIAREVNELISWIEAREGEPFDIDDPLVNLHANVALQVLVGKRYPWFSEGVTRMIEAGREFYEVTETCSGMELSLAPQYLPMWMVRLVFRRMLKRHVYTGFDNSHEIVREAMNEKRRDKLESDEPRDFLEAYLTQREDLIGRDRLIINTICIFMPDAIDSASSVGLWTLLYLGYNPEHQKKCQQQIDDVCGTRQPNLDDRSQLHWVEAVILEATRLGVPLPISLAHRVTNETTFRGFTIPRDNTCVIANLYAGNRDPEVFPEPEKFDPTRYLNAEGVFHRHEGVLSYGIGKRMCVGKAMTEVELFLIMANLLQRFSFRFPENQPQPSTTAMKGNMFRRPHPYNLIATAR